MEYVDVAAAKIMCDTLYVARHVTANLSDDHVKVNISGMSQDS